MSKQQPWVYFSATVYTYSDLIGIFIECQEMTNPGSGIKEFIDW